MVVAAGPSRVLFVLFSKYFTEAGFIRYDMTIGVLLDMDGTLIDSHKIHVECWHRTAAKEGVELDPDRINQIFGMVNREIIGSFWPAEVSEEKMHEIAETKESMLREVLQERFAPMPGATELVERLHEAGFKLAVASSAPKENVLLACKLLRIESRLGAILSGSDVFHGKPHPEIFLKAARAIDVPASNCVVIEDAVVGIRAAHAAGMKCFAYLSYGHHAEELAEADRIVRSLEEITPERVRHLLETTADRIMAPRQVR